MPAVELFALPQIAQAIFYLFDVVMALYGATAGSVFCMAYPARQLPSACVEVSSATLPVSESADAVQALVRFL